MDTIACATCLKDIGKQGCLRCLKCKKYYDLDCAKVKTRLRSMSNDSKQKWVCSNCSVGPVDSASLSRGEGSSHTANIATSPTSENPVTAKEVKDIIRSEIDSVMKKLEVKITDMFRTNSEKLTKDLDKKFTTLIHSNTENFTKELDTLKEALSFSSNAYEETKKELIDTRKSLKTIKEENTELKSLVCNLSNRLNLMEQNSRSANVEIQCMPEKKNENIVNTVLAISRVTGSNLKTEHIYHCTRVAKINTSSDRPRSIVVKFISPRTRDSFMAAVLKFNRKKDKAAKLNTSHLEQTGKPSPIYVTDHLTPDMKNLHAAARMKAKTLGFKHILLRNGRILLRETDDSEYIVIRDLLSLSKLKASHM